MAALYTQAMLDLVDAAITARLSGGAVQSYSVGGRNLKYISIEELTKLRDKIAHALSSASHGLPRALARRRNAQ